MSKHEALVIPDGIRFESTPDGVSIEHDGDIVLHGNPGPRLGRLHSRKGDVVLHVDTDAVAIEAPAGTVTAHAGLKVGRLTAAQANLNGDLNAETILVEGALVFRGPVVATRVRAGTVSFEGPTATVRSAEGERSVHVGKSRLQADILIAPLVVLDPGATGRVKVLESHNDLGAHAVRGCLRLADLEDMGGNAAAFLAERGLKPLGEPSGRVEPPKAEPAPKAEPPPKAEAPRKAEPPPKADPPPRVETPKPASAPPPPAPVIPPPAAAAPPAAVRRLGDDQADTNSDIDAPDPIQRDIREALDKILACYVDADLPPPIAELRDLVIRHDYPAIRDAIMQIWNQTLAWHKRYGPPRIHPQLSPNFNILNSLVRRL